MGTLDGGGDEEVARGNGEKIFVSVRLRPLSVKEIARNDVSDWECINDNTVIFRNGNLPVPDRSMYPTAYTFDRVFRSDSPTRQVYEEAAKEVALSVVSGINSSVFVYGQTSSGKTFTMTGITEYALSDIYAYIEKHTERQFHLKFSAMEIYNESVRDLLSSDSSALRLLDDPERGTVVEKLTEETLSDWNHVRELLSVCEAQRRIGETSLNEASSRSHQIVRLTIESSAREFLGKDNSSTLVSAVNFVDLAGSERASQSLAAGTRLKEGCHINRSLLTLGTVIRKLSKGRNGHIPFRDSKLTRILQSSLGGNARTAIICTMSPARSHVEQSRNTLLFASCAKEISTNAHVNVVMSDKALVNHLQRELARLESELRSPKSVDFTPMYSALLQEKDILIEKLEKDIKYLTLQRENAQTQFQNFVRMIGADRNSLVRVSSGEHPHLHIRKSESQNSICKTSILADPHSVEIGIRAFDTSQSFDEQSESSEHLHAQLLVLQGNNFHNDSSRRSISAPSSTDGGSFQGREENEELSDGTSEVVCKEVRCIDTEESSTEECAEFNLISSQEDSRLSAWRGIQERHAIYQESRSTLFREGEFMSASWKEGKDSVSLSCKEGTECMSLSPMKGGDYVLLHRKEDRKLLSGEIKDDKQLKSSSLRKDRQFGTPKLNKNRKLECIHSSVVPFLEKPSPCHDAMGNLSSSRSLKLSRSRSCRASFSSSMSCQWLDNAGNRDSTPPNGSEKDFTRRPEGFQRKLFALNHIDDAGSLSRKASQSSLRTAINIEVEAENEKTSKNGNATDISKSVAGEEQMSQLQHEKQADADSLTKKVQMNATQSLKTVKDVGLDPIEDDSKSAMPWSSQFKKLQGEIIELWHACNVSLVHRSYFFLLFNGHDQTDSVYMEVELRRLSFLKDAFTQGIKTVEDGVNLTPTSSMKTLRREREMLSREMQKRLSEQERDALYSKWGIGLNAKYRRLQLANHLWTKTQDLDHIADSAALILKLVGLEEQVSSPKAMFRLDFAPRMRKSSTFRRSLVPFL